MLSLFPHQEELISEAANALAQHRGVIMCAPTGSGKTVMAGHIIKRCHAKGGRVLIVVHRDYLVWQFHNTLTEAGLADDVGLISAGTPEQPWHPHQIAMAQTLSRRIDKARVTIEPTLIIVDEAHHSAANTWRKILDRFPDAKVLGLTATPQRPDGKGLNDIFGQIVYGLGTRELIKQGYLAPYDAYSIPTGADIQDLRRAGADWSRADLAEKILEGEAVADVAKVIDERARERKWIAFAPSIESSERLCKTLNGYGIHCQHLDGDTPRPLREAILKDFASGTLTGLCVVDLVSEGFDVPDADCAILYRKTKSVVIYLQQVGRVLRAKEGKRALVLDCCGLLHDENFGVPCAPRYWSLEGKSGTAREGENEVAAVQCEKCGAWMPSTTRACPACGHKRGGETPPSLKFEAEVELVRVKIEGGDTMEFSDGELHIRKGRSGYHNKEDVDNTIKTLVKGKSEDEAQAILRTLETELGYSPGWAKYIYGAWVREAR